jgi:hypothetical protein
MEISPPEGEAEMPRTKVDLLLEMRKAHNEMLAYLETLAPEQRTAPVLDDGWSVKDSLAHIAAWERMTVGWLQESLRGLAVKRYTPEFVEPETTGEGNPVMDALNQHLFEQNRERSWDEVLTDFEAAHRNLYALVERMTDNDIFNPARFAWRRGSPALDLLAGNSFDHYREHTGWMRKRFPS